MWEVHGSVQTYVMLDGKRYQLSSRPVWFRFSKFLPSNTRSRQAGSTEWLVEGDHVVSTSEHALRIAKSLILGDTFAGSANPPSAGLSFLTEATITVHDFDPSEEPMSAPIAKSSVGPDKSVLTAVVERLSRIFRTDLGGDE